MFSTHPRNNSVFNLHLFCRLQMLWIWTILKICRLVKNLRVVNQLCFWVELFVHLTLICKTDLSDRFVWDLDYSFHWFGSSDIFVTSAKPFIQKSRVLHLLMVKGFWRPEEPAFSHIQQCFHPFRCNPQRSTSFYEPAVQVFWKHRRKRRNCL